jgi:hypothetical protein
MMMMMMRSPCHLIPSYEQDRLRCSDRPGVPDRAKSPVQFLGLMHVPFSPQGVLVDKRGQGVLHTINLPLPTRLPPAEVVS